MSIFARVVIVKKKTIVECLYVNNIVEGFHCLNPLPERKENLPFSMYHNFLAAPFYLKKKGMEMMLSNTMLAYFPLLLTN